MNISRVNFILHYFCKTLLKIYLLADIPPGDNSLLQDNKHCGNEIYSADIHFVKLVKNLPLDIPITVLQYFNINKSGFKSNYELKNEIGYWQYQRVSDPNNADFLIAPVYGACYLRIRHNFE